MKRRTGKSIHLPVPVLIAVLAVIFCFCLKGNVKAADRVLTDGTYEINGNLKSASSELDSMGNGAIQKPYQLLVRDGQLTLRLECKALTSKLGSKPFTGYLAKMNYFPGWKGGNDGITLPKNEIPEAVKIESRYNGLYDLYNDPKKGLSDLKGVLYPHFLRLPLEGETDEIWVQIYVPVMESISPGNGLQYARLQLNWSSLKKISDELPAQDEEKTIEKGGLKYLLVSANALLSHKNLYTASTFAKLKKAVKTAQAVYTDGDATQKQVNAQMQKLSLAIKNLKEKKNKGKTTSGKQTEKLDFKNLADGVYAVEGNFVKTDRKTVSMADQAVVHKMKLTVKNKIYRLSLTFHGMNLNGQTGYLGKLSYYTSGYTKDRYGAPSGSKKKVTVNAYQKNAGSYPKQVTFPLIPETKKDGYAPLQVFVPVMESISKGNGTQDVYLKLDLSTVKKAGKNENFTTEEKSGNTTSSGTSGHKKSAFASSSFSGKKSGKVSQNPEAYEESAFGDAGQETGSQEQVNVDTGTDKMQKTQMMIPVLMSLLFLVAGMAYKVKSRKV